MEFATINEKQKSSTENKINSESKITSRDVRPISVPCSQEIVEEIENGSAVVTENENSEIKSSIKEKQQSNHNLCDTCGMAFTEKSLFDDHQKTCYLEINFPNLTENNLSESEETSGISIKKSNSQNSTTPKIKTENVQFKKCARCDVEYMGSLAWEKHQKNQSKNLNLCTVSSCNFKSCSVRGLERHRRKNHPDVNFPFNFKCDRCDVGFLRATNWKNHMQYKLKELKICPACPFKSCSIGSIYR